MIPSQNAIDEVDSKRIARKLCERIVPANRQQYDVDVIRRESDWQYELIQKMPDPSLTQTELADIKQRELTVPMKWVTIAVLQRYQVNGAARAIQMEQQNV